MFLFDKLDIEELLDPLFIERRHYCYQDGDGGDGDGGDGGDGNPLNPRPPRDCPDEDDDEDDATDEDDEGNLLIRDSAVRVAAFQEQCFLIDYQKTIREVIQGGLTARDRPVTALSAHQGTGELEKGALNGRWHDLIAIDGEPSTIVSKFTKRSGVEDFFRFTPAQLSFLIPRMRLFLVTYKNPGAGTESDAGRPQTVEEDKIKEFHFDDHTPENIVQQIMSKGRGRAYGIGLKSFDYELDGKDPATTLKSIKARLQLVFTSFDALMKEQGNGLKFLDLLLRTKRMIPQYDHKKPYASKNILNFCRTPKHERDVYHPNSELVFNPKYRRIKASVGWAEPPSDIPKNIFTSRDRALIEDMHLDLFLEMTNYQIDFNNNGTVRLTIEYRASIEGELSEPTSDIFFILKKNIKDQELRRKNKVKKLREKRGHDIDELESGSPNRSTAGDCSSQKSQKRKIRKEFKDRIDRVTKIMNAKIEIMKLHFYREFLEQMVDRQKIYRFQISKQILKVHRAYVPQAGESLEIGKKEKPNKTYADARENSTRPALEADVKKALEASLWPVRQYCGDEGIRIDPIDCELGKLQRERMAAQEEMPRDRDNDAGLGAPDQGAGSTAPPVNECGESPMGRMIDQTGSRVIYFMYLGDLLDTAMYYVNHRNPNHIGLKPGVEGTNVRLCTAAVDFHNFEDRFDSVNIADIPVSLEQFVVFFRDKVIKRGRTSYMAQVFIKDVMNDLFFKVMGDACYGGRGAPVPALSTTMISTRRRPAPGLQPGHGVGFVEADSATEPIPRIRHTGGTRALGSNVGQGQAMCKGTVHNTWAYPRLLRPDAKIGKHKVSKYFSRPRDSTSSDQIIHYYIIHGIARSFTTRHPNRKKDENEGIYHLGLGLDRGIVKEIKFEAAEIKYAAEARTIYDGEDGLGQLFQKFNATVDLFGCPIFRNGQYIYIDPKTMGVKSDVARTIGLGGYYNIYNVMGQLTPSGYTTRLRCMFNSSGICPDSDHEIAETPDAIFAETPGGADAAPAASGTPAGAGIPSPGPPGTYSSREEARGRSQSPDFDKDWSDDEKTDYYECLNEGSTHETCSGLVQHRRISEITQGGGLCFIAETLISMYDGTTKAIKDIVVGDIVLSLKDDKYVEGVVTEHLIHPTNQTIEIAKLGNLIGEPTHPLYVDGQWLEMKELDNVEFEYKHVDIWYNLEIDGRDVYGSEHNYIAEGWVVSGLGDDEILNNTFQRQKIFKTTQG